VGTEGGGVAHTEMIIWKRARGLVEEREIRKESCATAINIKGGI